MKDIDTDITVGTGKLKFRFIIFIIAFAVAVAAFAIAVTSFNKMDEGYYEITAKTMEELPFYASDYTFFYYFEGKSGDIKEANNALTSAYSNSLSRIYRMLDAKNLYDGYKNIAYVNAHIGEEVEVSDELYKILKDAYAKSGEKSVYSIFSAPIYELWRSILILDDPYDFDIIKNEDNRKLLDGMNHVVFDGENVSLEFTNDEKHIIKLDISDKYKEFRKTSEIKDYPIIDIGILKDAYALEWLKAELTGAGYTKGYICSAGGASVCLGDELKGVYQLYSYDGEKADFFADVAMEKGSAYCLWTSFPIGNKGYGFYSIKNGNETLWRNSYHTKNGAFPNLLMSAAALDKSGSAVNAAYETMRLYSAKTEQELENILKKSDIMLVYILCGDDTIFVNEKYADKILQNYGERKISILK